MQLRRAPAHRKRSPAPLWQCDPPHKENLPTWERATRAIAGIAMAACGFLAPGLGGTSAGLIVSAVGALTLLSGLVGFCPACAMVGRRLPTS
jgi:hypothetical protein